MFQFVRILFEKKAVFCIELKFHVSISCQKWLVFFGWNQIDETNIILPVIVIMEDPFMYHYKPQRNASFVNFMTSDVVI